MKRRLTRQSETSIRQSFPIHGHLAGRFFRIDEISAGAYQVEGTDLFGRRVSRHGSNPDHLLEQCIEDAKGIQNQTS